MEKTTTKEYYDLTVYGVEGIHYNKVDGKIKLTEQRDKDLGSSAPWQVLALYYDKYMKTVSSAAPQEYNDAKIQYLDSIGYYDKGTLDPFAVINSDTFLTVWPKVQQEWISMGVKAIVGQITMDEYKAYVDKINNNPDFKKAYKEFAESYKEYFGK
ncbi:hypothetical protein ACHHV8_15400 [Paenibacillus sp. TAB 01]|uniref:hypothetical protein n=1 Tax=Paenibacillus sp. TAB 01 TaxID=3368988 RepID=UPI003752685F